MTDNTLKYNDEEPKWQETPLQKDRPALTDKDNINKRLLLLEMATIKHENALEALCDYLNVQLEPCSALRAVRCDAKKQK